MRALAVTISTGVFQMTKTTTAKPDDNNVPETLERSIETNEPAVPKNALVHGVYSEATVRPWESEKEFNEQHSSFREDLNPQGSYEEDLVGLITLLQWQKRRLFRGQKMAFLTDPMAKEWTEAGKDGWQGIERYV